jgi:hypothetical protein
MRLPPGCQPPPPVRLPPPNRAPAAGANQASWKRYEPEADFNVVVSTRSANPRGTGSVHKLVLPRPVHESVRSHPARCAHRSAVAAVAAVLVAIGTGLTPRVVVLVLFSWVFIALDTRAGIRAVDSRLIEMAQSFGATERQIWRKILVRGGMPGIVAGLRIGLSRALAGMVTAELLMVAAGIGGLLLEFRGDFRADGVFAVVLVVVLESLVVMQLARWMERRLVQPTATAVQHRTAVSLQHVHKHCTGLAEKTSTAVLDDVSLDIHEGESLIVLGPSGCDRRPCCASSPACSARGADGCVVGEPGRTRDRLPDCHRGWSQLEGRGAGVTADDIYEDINLVRLHAKMCGAPTAAERERETPTRQSSASASADRPASVEKNVMWSHATSWNVGFGARPFGT